MTAPTTPALSALPDAVRGKVVSLVAAALPEVVRLPPALARVASFAPARRAKAGATMIVAALGDETGDELRERIAHHLAEPAGDLDGADPVEVAARAWLVRPEGWTQVLVEALARIAGAAGPAAGEEEARLRARVASLEEELRDTRADRRARLDELKAENATLRRKLGEARSRAREAGTGREEALAEAQEARSRAEEQVAERDRTVRQLRQQVERLESELGAQRRAVRQERDDAGLRARFLLDTLLDAASGLRRELALPPVNGAPGDRVEAELTGLTASGAATVVVTGGPHLEQYLAMPRVRLIVDGYNVSKSLWPSSSLEAQRIRLLQALAPVVARTGAETTVVFDAAASEHRPAVAAPRGVKVVFSPLGIIADDVIRDLVAAEPVGRVVLVVTDDQEVVRDVRRDGARPVAVSALAGLLG
ncbi:NYN domain-containing protein [Nocardioides sp. DS6]|uniref:NYN domain-containing protein n=1 Tax=Nocardioides eburneus TaxID=3231482 RepID=A0ABV3T0J9_9ACTN